MMRACFQRVDKAVGFHYVVYITMGGYLHALQVVHCVVSVAVASAAHLFEQFGMPPHVVAHHKESCFNAVSVEQVEHPGCNLRYRTVIESQVHHLAPALLYPPYRLRKKEAIWQWRLFD